VAEATEQRDRLRALVDAGIALSSELSLDSLLQRLVETAAELTGARYVALGVVAQDGRGLERFVTHGVDAELRAEIGELPRGRGILGVLIRDGRPLRLHEIADDPRSVGFPPGHPPMHTFLGVPVELRGKAHGNLYLTEKADGDFTADDEDLVTVLASQAAVAIENARLYESATGWLRQVESLNEVSTALLGELELPPLLALVSARLRELVDARLVIVALPTADRHLRVEAADGDGADAAVGAQAPVEGSKLGRVFERARSERVDSLLDDPEVDRSFAGLFKAQSALNVPLVVRGTAIGAMAAFDKRGRDGRFSDEDLRLAEAFAERAALAVDLSRRVTQDALRKVLQAQEIERRRLARELHDETGQALTSILLGLRAVENAAAGERAEALAAVRERVVATLQDVRRLAVELRPKALDDFGLVAALERLAETFAGESRLRVDLEARLGDERLPSETETAVYRTVQEALTNIAKHAGATTVSILLSRKEGAVTAVVEDDGRGFDPTAARADALGLSGMRERLALVGGRLSVETAEGRGTTIVAEVPS
jgi:two-component system, NarL family, sensor histidine kinase DevS